MKAAVYYETGGPEVFRYEELPDPACHPRGLLVRVEAISIEGGDVLNRAGGEMAGRPHIVGYQCAGTVVEAGAEVTDYKAGDRIVATMPYGSHASMASVPARAAWHVPEGADLREIACVPVAFGTADDCLFEFGRLKSGDVALIQGAGGGVGLAAVQLAKRAGATVLGTASSQEKLDRLREFGLDHGINYREQDLVQEVRTLTQGHGADVVVDPVGTTLSQSLASLAYRGRVTLVGNAGRGDTHIDARPLMGGNQSLIGVFLGAEMASERVRSMIQRHIDDVASGDLKVIIDRVFPLSEAAAAHAYIESRGAFGRVVLVP